jgi:hypothetical protein
MKTLPQINDNEVLEVIGDVIVNGSIGLNARLIVKNGAITINGDIKAYSEIIASTTSFHVTSSAVFFAKQMVDLNQSIYIYGSVDASATISAKYGSIIFKYKEKLL